ncbi:hypothetical protein NX059_006490 [Plenodomus lindquistii]|nr:hypothetical protein NX059_006490 [Plenodomus lindquistii]
MTDSEAPKPAEDPKANDAGAKSKEITLTLPSPDGAFEATILLEQHQDATRPPKLVSIDKNEKLPSSCVHNPEQRETHIILSIGSGHRQAETFFKHVVSPILSTLYGEDIHSKSKTHVTQSETSILEFTNNIFFPAANAGTPLRIILASGDGGMVDLVNGLLAQPKSQSYVSPQIVLLPLGTANALYHSINAKSPSNTWGLHALTSTTTKPLPTFTVSFSPGSRLLINEGQQEQQLPKSANGDLTLHGAVVCSWGMHATLVADSDTTAYRKFGIDRFKMAATEALYPADGSLPHAYKAQVSIQDSKNSEWTPLPEEEHMYVLATMVSNLEQPFCISPASKPLDGSLRLVHFGPTTGDEAMRIMGLAYQGGKHVDDEKVRYEEVDKLRIRFKESGADGRWRRVCVDGKIVRVEEGGWMVVGKAEGRVVDVVVVE